MSALRDSIASATAKRAREFVSGLGEPIHIQVAECRDYSALLRGDHDDAASPETLLEWARQRGRVIVSGRGASGKSALLYRLALEVDKQGGAPFLIDLSRWSQTASVRWERVSGTARDAIDFLLTRFSASGHDITDVEFLPASTEKFFLLDGLNETPGGTADQILKACDQIASIIVGASVIVTDRLVRRTVDAEYRWRFVMPLPVQDAEVARLTMGKDVPAGVRPLLDSPFFLDAAIRGEMQQSTLKTIRELIKNRGKLSATELAIAAKAAFEAYAIDRSRTFSLTRFGDLEGASVAKRFIEGGILLTVEKDRVAFGHHWYHDYLASKYVVDNPKLWSFENRHRTFDALTFKANSFDAVAFALEQLTAPANGEFLRAVYDWSPYAAGYALAEAKIKPEDVPDDVRLIILGMLAARRFDRQYLTARKAEDALDLQRYPMAKRLRDAKSLPDLLRVIEETHLESLQYEGWKALFTLGEKSVAPEELLKALEDEDSVVGWTAANVLKRLILTDGQLKAIYRASEHPRAVVRWRAVHTMGGFVNEPFIARVLDRLDHDEDENVRYGAIRSFVELASRDEARLHHMVDLMIEHSDSITRSPQVLVEFEWAIFLSKGCAPASWVKEISRVIYCLLDQSSDATQVERWSKLASRLRVHHRTDSRAAA